MAQQDENMPHTLPHKTRSHELLHWVTLRWNALMGRMGVLPSGPLTWHGRTMLLLSAQAEQGHQCNESSAVHGQRHVVPPAVQPEWAVQGRDYLHDGSGGALRCLAQNSRSNGDPCWRGGVERRSAGSGWRHASCCIQAHSPTLVPANRRWK